MRSSPILVDSLVRILPIPRVAFFDIDGTLVGKDGVLLTSTVRSMQILSQHGCLVGLATGRSLFGAQSLIQQLPLSGISVFFAGALVINTSRNEVLSQKSLPTPGIERVIEWARSTNRYLEWYTRDHYYIESNHPFAKLHAEYLAVEPTVTSFSELDPVHCIKLELISRSREEDDEIRNFVAKVNGIDSTFATGPLHPELHFVNLVSTEASREKVFEELLQYFQVSSAEVACFGDSDGDIPFVRGAGIGVAMKNATPGLREHARYVTHHCENGGISYALKHLFGIEA